MAQPFQPEDLARIHDDAIATWHGTSSFDSSADNLSALILAQHRANFDLWHQEDDARDPDASPSRIADIKHAIDRINQQRNDLVERIDTILLGLAEEQNPAAPLHSETPGMIVDRLSILALKVFHTREEAHRASASPEHRARNQVRLEILLQQRAHLAQCLCELWMQALTGQRRFQLYHQFKMYNDPELNPILYNRD